MSRAVLIGCLRLTFVVLLLVCQSAGIGFITFRSIHHHTADVITFTSGGHVSWDAAWPTMTRLILLGNENVSISFYCAIEKLQGADALEYIDFFFERRKFGYPRWTTTLNLKENKMKLAVGTSSNLISDVTLDEAGGNVTLINVPPEISVDNLQFSCKATNRYGHRTSNIVELFDYRNQFSQDVRTVDEPKQATNVRRPFWLPCLDPPLKKDHSILIPYEWSFCDEDNLSPAARCQSILKMLPSWRVVILENGTLYWPYVPRKVATTLQGKKLRCSIGGRPITVYSRKLNFTSPRMHPQESVTLVQPAVNQELRIFDSSSMNVSLPVIINGDGEDVKLIWNKDGVPLQTGLKTGKCALSYTDNCIPFYIGEFSNDTDGNYSLTVLHQRKDSKSKVHYGNYIIRTDEGYAKMDESMETVIFVPDGGDMTLKCRYKRPDLVIPTFTFAGKPINYDSLKSIADDIAFINHDLRNAMVPLNASINLARPWYGSELLYSAFGLVYRSRRHGNLSSSHYVECLGYRWGYSVRHPVVVQVVPRPVMAHNGTPSDSLCHNQTRCTFKCVVTNRKEIESLGVELRIIWKWSVNITGSVTNAFIFEKDRDKLHVRPRLQSDSKGVIVQGTVSCVLEMRYPDRTPVGPDRRRTFYSSSDDRQLRLSLKAPILLRISDASFQAPVVGMTLLYLLLSIVFCVFFFIAKKSKSHMKKKQKLQGTVISQQYKPFINMAAGTKVRLGQCVVVISKPTSHDLSHRNNCV